MSDNEIDFEATCECGWVSGGHWSSSSAEDAAEEHREEGCDE